jgi:DNA-binding response OmpR family regulator
MNMSSSKKTILIVEDEAPLREALVDKLEREGYKTLSAKDGVDGLTQALENKPDLILLDILLPKKDGLSLLKDLRQNAWGKTAKVIMLTNLSNWSNTKEAVDYNVRDYLVKSDWKISDVVKVVNKKLA